jgi:ferric-dicitrate binding protein FerR (iron transport regulator)
MSHHLAILAAVLLLVQPAMAEAPAAKVLSINGKLTVNGRAATPGTVLRSGDVLATPAGSQAFIGFPDGSALRLNAGSKLKLSDLAGKTALDLRSGSALSAVHKGSAYSIATPRAVAAVRGTVFYVEATKLRPTYVCVCEGKVRVTSGRHSQLISTETHQAVSVRRGRLKSDKMLGHTDAEIAELKGYAH